MYKIVFFDVDGTLLSEVDGCMPSSTKEAIGKLTAKGIKVVVATGRPYSLCEEFRGLGVDTIISANGALVQSNGEVIHKSLLKSETVRGLTAFAGKYGHGLSYFTDLLTMNGLGFEDERMKRALQETLSLTEYPETRGSLSEEIYCMCLYADEHAAQKYIEQFPKLRFVRFHGYVMNVLEETEVSKSTAVRKVLEHFGLSPAEAVAFGDGGNDIDMLEYVVLGIAMGNGGEQLKQKADFVTKKASEGGIAYALQKYGLI